MMTALLRRSVYDGVAYLAGPRKFDVGSAARSLRLSVRRPTFGYTTEALTPPTVVLAFQSSSSSTLVATVVRGLQPFSLRYILLNFLFTIRRKYVYIARLHQNVSETADLSRAINVLKSACGRV